MHVSTSIRRSRGPPIKDIPNVSIIVCVSFRQPEPRLNGERVVIEQTAVCITVHVVRHGEFNWRPVGDKVIVAGRLWSGNPDPSNEPSVEDISLSVIAQVRQGDILKDRIALRDWVGAGGIADVIGDRVPAKVQRQWA